MFQVNPLLAAVFSSKDKGKKLKCRLLQFLFGVLRVNTAKTRGWSGGAMVLGKLPVPGRATTLD